MRQIRRVLCLALLDWTVAWNVSRLAGIWKLATNQLPRPEPTIVQRALGQAAITTINQVVWLKLNPDGTFRQCNEGYVEGVWISGCWALIEENTSTSSGNRNRLKFVLNRNYYGPPYDITLEGNLQQEQDGIIVKGDVYKGKISLPRSDLNFFRSDLDNQQVLGPFRLERTIATSTEIGSSIDGVLLEDDGVFL